ncbi:hypothetical protein [Pyramidobacter sp. CG50-2]|uniref:hypothetical protein n=1 Tax=Pyramidobacter sp. CG50-2 TaxID=2382160 RepID=UPI00237CC555|nr:hypothetical protein [Pyramidobacter sp. CG50-2]
MPLCNNGAIVIVADREWAQERGLKPLAEILGYSAAAKAGLKLSDMDLIEINEAFAAQVIVCHREMPFDMEKLDVHGGAIALGHPIGATGAKIATTLINALDQRDKELGIRHCFRLHRRWAGRSYDARKM